MIVDHRSFINIYNIVLVYVNLIKFQSYREDVPVLFPDHVEILLIIGNAIIVVVIVVSAGNGRLQWTLDHALCASNHVLLHQELV